MQFGARRRVGLPQALEYRAALGLVHGSPAWRRAAAFLASSLALPLRGSMRAAARCVPRSARGSAAGWSAAASAPGLISMQSTGQGGRHSSQPVQRSARTVCMYFAAPTMASTGQGARQRAQPMQRASSIHATRGGPSTPWAGFSGSSGRRRSVGQARDRRPAARRALVDLRLAACDRRGVGFAPGIAAASALSLRQQRIDARHEVRRGLGHHLI